MIVRRAADAGLPEHREQNNRIRMIVVGIFETVDLTEPDRLDHAIGNQTGKG